MKSRFESDEIGGEAGFVASIEKLGFTLIRKVGALSMNEKNVENTHFGLFFFKKTHNTNRKKASTIPSLKACLYKKR